MTTQINIIVDDGGLPKKAKEQMDANRWIALEKNGQKLTARKSKEMRDQELAKQGKAPDGKPQSTAPAKPSFRRDEPAAQRTGVELPYFYVKRVLNDYGETVRFEFRSGDGTKTAQSPTISSAIDAENSIYQQSALTTLQQLYPGALFVTGGLTSATARLFLGVVSQDGGFTTNEYQDITLDQSTQRLGAAHELILPISRDQAIFAYRMFFRTEGTALTETHTFTRKTDGFQIYQQTFVNFGLTATATAGASGSASFAFLVGKSVAQPITLPAGLWSAIDAYLPSYGAETSNIVRYATCSTASFAIGGQCLGYANSPSATVELTSTTLEPANGISVPASISYGVAGDETAVTPLTWFWVKGTTQRSAMAPEGSVLHYDHTLMRGLTIDQSGPSVGSLIQTRYIGIPPLDPTSTTTSKTHKWSSAAPPEDTYITYGYPFFSSGDPRWQLDKGPRVAGYRHLPDDDFLTDTNWQRYYIYDWGSPAFCRDQAAAYGITTP